MPSFIKDPFVLLPLSVPMAAGLASNTAATADITWLVMRCLVCSFLLFFLILAETGNLEAIPATLPSQECFHA